MAVPMDMWQRVATAPRSTATTSTTPKTTTTKTKTTKKSSSAPAATTTPEEPRRVYFGSTISADNPVLKGIEELSALYGGITYNRDEIEGIFHNAITKQYDADKVAKNQQIDNYTRSIGAAAQSMGQEMARSRASGVLSGANTGMNAASDLTAMTSFQQATAADALTQQQELYQLTSEYNAAIAAGTKEALEYANTIKQAIATLAAEIYGVDTQKYAAQLGYNAAIEEANTAASASQYATDINADTTKYTVDKQIAASKAAARSAAAAGNRTAASYEFQTISNLVGNAGMTVIQELKDATAAKAFMIDLVNVLGGIKPR